MKEISERLRNTIVSAIPTDNLVLAYLPLYGTNPTITDRVSSANNGTFTNGKWKTLKNGLVVPSFDGTAYIRNATANWRSGDSQGAIGVFFKRMAEATAGVLFNSADNASTVRFLDFRVLTTGFRVIQQNNDTVGQVKGTGTISLNTVYSAFLTSTGTAWDILLNGAALSLTVEVGVNNGDWFADTSARDDFVIGAQYRNSVFANYLVGQTFLVVVYSVAPSTAEILQMHNRLKGVFR